MASIEEKTLDRRPVAYERAWELAAREIDKGNLRGLSLLCPKCHEPGTLMSKWIPKNVIKPLYVIHGNGNGQVSKCGLDEQQAGDAREAIRFSYEDAVKAVRMGRPFVLLSGGRDSVCTLAYMEKIARRVGRELTAIHAETTAGFPEVEEYVKTVCTILHVRLVTVRPERDFFELAKRWGIPGVRARWCCSTLKVAPIKRFLAGVRGPKVVFDGIRAAESPVRARYVPVWFHPSFRCISVSPIFAWSDRRLSMYFEKTGLPDSPTASMGTSGECWCGAYKCRSDFEELLEVHPEIFDKLVQVEKAQRGRFTFVYENGEQVRLSTIRRRRQRWSTPCTEQVP